MKSRRLLPGIALWAALLAAGLTCAHAKQVDTHKTHDPETETRQEPDFKWHLVNTGIFAVLLGLALAKLGPRFFNARSADIQKAIKDATGLKIQADFRSSEIDRKMATLPEEVERMRLEARQAMEREHERRKAETQQHLRQIESSLAGEIAGMRADGAQLIRQAALRAAFRLAEQRARERAGERDGHFWTDDFVNLVERGSTR